MKPPEDSSLKTILICATPRSGSYLLADLLAQAGLPFAEEWLTPAQQSGRKRKYGLTESTDFKVYLNRLMSEESRNGYFLLKLMPPQLILLREWVEKEFGKKDLSNAEILNHCFGTPKVIYLFREHSINQAISYVKAKQSGNWIKTKDEPRDTNLVPEYSFISIAEALNHQNYGNAVWEELIVESDLESIKLSYEQLIENFKGRVQDILNLIGIKNMNYNSLQIEKNFQKSSDSLNSEWAKKYYQDLEKCRNEISYDSSLLPEIAFKSHSLEAIYEANTSVLLEINCAIENSNEAFRYLQPNGDGWPRICIHFQGFGDNYYHQIDLRLVSDDRKNLIRGRKIIQLPPVSSSLLVEYVIAFDPISFDGFKNKDKQGSFTVTTEWRGAKKGAREALGELRELRNGWQYSDWFGYLLDDKFPWIYHGHHEWLFIKPSEKRTGWIDVYDCVLGWFETNSKIYPQLVHLESRDSYRFSKRMGNNRYFSVNEERKICVPTNGIEQLKRSEI